MVKKRSRKASTGVKPDTATFSSLMNYIDLNVPEVSLWKAILEFFRLAEPA